MLSTGLDEPATNIPNASNETHTDIWALLSEDREACQKQNLTSWDTFLSPTLKIIRSPYLSEQSVQCVDAVFEKSLRSGTASPVFLKSQFFLSALSQLGLGRSSSLFTIDTATGESECSLTQIGQFGLSGGLINKVTQDFRNWGQQWWKIRSFLNQQLINHSSKAINIAFASALSTVLHGLEKRLRECYARSESVLQLHQHYHVATALLNSLTRILTQINATKTDTDLLLILAEETSSSKVGNRWTSQVILEILQLCAQPLLIMITQGTGLRLDSNPKVEEMNQSRLAEYEAIISPDIVRIAKSTNESLTVLRKHQPDHPILSPSFDNWRLLDMSWETTWEGIDKQWKTARDYEHILQDEANNHSEGQCINEVLPSYTNYKAAGNLENPQSIWQNLPSLDWGSQDVESGKYLPPQEMRKLFTLASKEPTVDDENSNSSDSFEPTLFTALSLSLHPVLSVHSAAVNSACLRLIFKESELRSHIKLQWRYQFLMDPEIRLRLCGALFDTSRKYSIPLPSNGALPSEFSFGIEDIGDEQLGTGSIEIVDLLRLHYQPPSALQYIFTEQSLRLYQRIFRYVLGILRFQHLTQSLARQFSHKSIEGYTDKHQHKLRIDTHRAICALNDYVGTIAIGLPFNELQDRLREIEILIDNRSIKDLKIQDIQEMHQSTLRQILDNLFLGDDAKQRKLQKALSKVFRTIVKEGSAYSSWKQHMAKLLALLRASGTKNSKYLALKLDMNGYYG